MRGHRVSRSSSALLFRIAEMLAPPKTQDCIAAIRAESNVVPDDSSQVRWAVSGLFTAVRANVIDDCGGFVLLALMFGISAAYIDLQTVTRVPLQVILTVCALLISLFGPSRALLAIPALLAGRSLLIICLSFPEPYSVDQTDVLYSVVPIAIGACAGLAGRALFFRGRWSWCRFRLLQKVRERRRCRGLRRLRL